MNIVLVYNKSSGQHYSLAFLRSMFKRHGIHVAYSFNTKQLGSRKLLELIQSGVIVASVGGDGTHRSVARLLIHTPSTMIPLPGGTFNHFARDLTGGLTFEESVAQIKHAPTRLIDVAVCNTEIFLNNSNLGLYPFSLIEVGMTKRIAGKYIAAIHSAYDQLKRFKKYRLLIDGKKVSSPFVFVGNNVFDNKNSLIPRRTRLDKGKLTIMVASSRSRFRLIRAIYAVLRGTVSRQDDFILSYRKQFAIYSPHPTLTVTFDGEVRRLEPPLMYKSDPKSPRVLVLKDRSR